MIPRLAVSKVWQLFERGRFNEQGNRDVGQRQRDEDPRAIRKVVTDCLALAAIGWVAILLRVFG